MRILIVDDASATRTLLTRFLHASIPGVEVSQCANGQGALILLSSEIQFDLILLDLNLPDLDGLKVLEFIDSLPDKAPVITLGEKPEEAALLQSLKRGATSFLTKPIQKKALVRQIARKVSLKLEASVVKRVLVVEDDPMALRLHKRILESAGYETLTASNGYEAIRAAKSQTLDCIVMDINMPYMDGREASRLILREFPFVPIIALTAESLVKLGDELLDIGIKAVLGKPTTKEHLLVSVEIQIDRATQSLEGSEFDLVFSPKEERAEEMGVQEDFFRFVPRSFVNPDDLNKRFQRGLRQEEDCSVLFIDIRRFTEMTEAMSATETFNFLNSYFEMVEPIVNSFGGMVYQFLGDGIVCTFPLYKGKYTNNAIHAAISIQDRITIYNRGRERAGYSPIAIGAGISTGPLAMGICGSPNRYEVGAFGSTMNIAARSQSMCRDLGIDIVITSKTFERIDHPSSMLIRSIGHFALKGIRKDVQLYEVFSHCRPEDRNLKSQCLEALSSLGPNWTQENLEGLASTFPEDGVWRRVCDQKKLRTSLN